MPASSVANRLAGDRHVRYWYVRPPPSARTSSLTNIDTCLSSTSSVLSDEYTCALPISTDTTRTDTPSIVTHAAMPAGVASLLTGPGGFGTGCTVLPGPPSFTVVARGPSGAAVVTRSFSTRA